jgi:hypothetical protein
VQMQVICTGKLKGEDAAQVLRAATRFYNEGQEGLATLNNGIQRAEEMLAYGPDGRPSRNFDPSWGTSERRALADNQIAKIFSAPPKSS